MSEGRLQMHQDMRGYFRDCLVRARQGRGVDMDESTEWYLVDLMATYGSGRGGGLGRPFVELLAAALEAEHVQERFRRFRHMGDTALCVSGFFCEHLRRRGVSQGYVTSMGRRAYSAAGDLCGRAFGAADPWMPGMYRELVDRFEDFAALFDEVREESSLRTPQDIVRLYDRWRATRSSVLAERLRAEGVFPQRPDDCTLH